MVRVDTQEGPWWRELRGPGAPKIIARLPFVERPDHPAGMPVFVIAQPLAEAAVRDVVLYDVTFQGEGEGLGPSPCPHEAEILSRAKTGSGLSLMLAAEAGAGFAKWREALDRSGAAGPKRERDRQPCGAFRCARHPKNGRRNERVPERTLMTKIALTGMNSRPRPRPGVLEIDPYVPGQSSAPGASRIFKLSANETPLGPSPRAREALRDYAAHLQDYPDGAATLLREAIGAKHGLDPARIVCGNGSDDLLHLLAAAYIGPGDEGIFTQHGFLVYKIAILASGGIPIEAEENNLTASVDTILAKVGPRTRIVFLANPNNPTGTYLPIAEVERLAARLPSHVLLVLDAAYAEYAARAWIIRPARSLSRGARTS